jgi:hypothetical protein
MLDKEQHLFLYWIKEREIIREKRAARMPAPWTKDEILQKYRFCNVVRNDDRVSQWIQSRVQPDDPLAAFNLLASRWFNEPATLEKIGWPWHRWQPDKVLSKLEEMAENREKIFRAAYIINGAIPPWGVPKYEKVVRTVLTPAKSAMADFYPSDTCEEAWTRLLKLDGMGQFMSGQVVADWYACRLIDGEDAREWAPLGPGSRRGLAIAWGIEKATSINQKTAVGMFREAYTVIQKKMPKLAQRMTLHDVQNCFCEFSKYRRGYGKQHFVSGG